MKNIDKIKLLIKTSILEFFENFLLIRWPSGILIIIAIILESESEGSGYNNYFL